MNFEITKNVGIMDGHGGLAFLVHYEEGVYGVSTIIGPVVAELLIRRK